MKDRIMIVDDSKELRDILFLYLTNAGYKVIEAEDGEDALKKLEEEKVSLMILDVMMPKIDGFQLINILGDKRDFPVIFLSAKNQVEDKIKGLSLGGDDYVAKPFDPSEVMARVMAILRRNKKYEKKEDLIDLGNLKWDRGNRIIYKDGETLELRAKEYKLLTMFMNRPGKVFTKQEIYEFLWKEVYFNDDNVIMVHISNLRDKIEENPKKPKKIITVRGLGYMMNKED